MEVAEVVIEEEAEAEIVEEAGVGIEEEEEEVEEEEAHQEEDPKSSFNLIDFQEFISQEVHKTQW
jgi:hypothetical protein